MVKLPKWRVVEATREKVLSHEAFISDLLQRDLGKSAGPLRQGI